MRLSFTFVIAFSIVSLLSHQSVGQFRMTEERCAKEHQRGLKMGKSIIRTYTKGSRAVSQATAERMARNVEIAVDAMCSSAVKRNLNARQFQRESERVLQAAMGYSMHNEGFDLRDPTIAANFYRTGKYIVEPTIP